MLNQRTEETVLSFHRVPHGEWVHLLSLPKSDSRTVMWLLKGAQSWEGTVKQCCVTLLWVLPKLRSFPWVFSWIYWLLALSWQPRRDCDSQCCSRLYQTLSNTVWVLDSREKLKGYNLHGESNPEKPPAAALVPGLIFQDLWAV